LELYYPTLILILPMFFVLWFKSQLAPFLKIVFTISSIICFISNAQNLQTIILTITVAFIIWEKNDREHSL